MHHSTAWQAKSEGDASAAYVQYVSSLQPFPERRIRVTGTSAYETAALVKVMVKKVLHSSNNAICLAVFQESLQRDSLDFKTLLRFFISQIISQRPTTFSHIWPLYLHNEKLGPTSAVGVLWSYFTILLAALRDCKIVFAITEVQDDSERSFIELDELEKVLKSINSDYLIVTSAYAAVDSEFRRTDSRIDINLGPDDALRRPIIQSIVSEAIRKHTGSTKLALLHDRNAELAEITSIGQATRYAALLSRSLLLSTTNAVDDTLSIVPRSEDRMFQYCLQYMDEKLLQWCDAMISWVYRAVRPLRTQELAVAVALQLKPSEKTQLAPYISQRLERDIGLHLSPILKVEQDFVYFHAETTKKYIEKINSDPLSMRGLNIPTHGQIASICLQYLQHYLEAAASQQDEPTDDVQVEWEWRFVGCHSQQPELGLLDYAIQHWPTHYLAHIQLNDGMSFQGNKEQFSRSMEHTTSLEDSDVHSQVIRFLNADTLRNQWYKRFRCQISPDTDCNRSTTSTEVAGALGFFFDVDIYLTPDKYGYHALLGLENESRSPESANLEKLLRVTVRYGHSELVKFPLSKGAKRSDAFLAAASCGRLDLLQLLADDSIFQNTNDHLSGMAMYPAAMQLAARAGDLSCFEFCGRLTGNHEWIKQSTSFLHSAAAGGNVKILEYLWKGGNLDLDYEEDSGVSALMLATQLNQAQFAAALCKLGADTNKVNDEGETALHMAVLKDPTITEVLLQHKADARAKDKIKQTALHYACKIGNSAVVIQLIKALARDEALDAPDIHRETPLSIATAGGNAELVRLLLDAGAEASKNISNEHHEHSPLYIAASCGNLAVFKLLYSSSKLPYPFLEALFMRAIEQRQLPIVRSLLNDLKSIDFHTVRGYSPLESACGEGYIDIVRFLLQKGAHPNFADNNGHTPLHSAAKEGHEDVVRLLLEYKCDPNPRLFTERQTPLLLAVSGWHSKSTIVKILLDSGADVHVQDVNGNTASHLAVAWPDAVDILLSYDPKLDTLNHGGETPLHRAVKDHHTRTVKLLVKKDPALIHVCDERELTPIHYAIEQSDWYKHDISILEFLCSIDGFKFDQSCYRKRPPILMALGWPNLAAARFLLSKRPDLAAAKSEGNMSALHIAAVKDLVEIVDALFDASSDIEIEARTDEGYTPLHLASQYGGPMMIRKLLEHHADVNAVSPNGDTALTEACYRRRIDNLEFVNTLLQAGANCNLREAHKAPLLLAVDKPLVVEELLKHGANVDGAVDADDKTPLMAAASGNHRQCLDSVRLLLGWKADVEIRDRSGSTALHMAAHADNPLRYKILLDAGANPSVIDNAGQTPLHRAVLFCSPESRVAKVEMLLERGAIINVVDGVGYTPLHIVAGLGTEYGHRLLELITNIYLSQSLDLDGNDEAKQTPLHRALDDGYSYAVKHLIRNGAQLRNQEQRSCLEIAAGSNRERDEKIKCLLESGQWTSTDKVKALLVASKKDLGTALILAKHDAGMFESENETFAVLYDCLRTNRPKEAGTFLELGANPFRSQSGQLSPFQIAYLSDDDEMFETFLKGCENKLKGSSPDQRAIFQALRCAFETTKRERTEEFSRWRARHTYRTMTDEDGWSMAHYDDHYHLGNLWSDHQRLYPVPLAPTKLVIPSYWVLNETISRGHDLLHVEDRTAYYKGECGC
ncbi:ankyrin repeat-containing domain protein [Xylariaceae sp. FL1019]|nr:ankyrin repeat-containing domain protein [Xylariaceae sp. FL1019]